jgi:hypothetical protein
MTNNPPGVISRPGLAFTFKATAQACATTNVNLATATDPLGIDGQTIRVGGEFLLTGQTTPAQNGLYTMAANGAELATGTYNGSGVLDITCPNATSLHQWVKGNGTQAVGQTTLTDTGTLVPGASAKITLNGPPNTACTGSLKVISPVRDASLDASAEFQPGVVVRVLNGTSNAGTWQYTGVANPTLGTTALPWSKASSATSAAVQPPLAPPTFTNTPPGALDPCAVPADA